MPQVSRFTPQMFKKMGFGVYLLFASLMVVSIPIVWLLIPETSGIPLESMDELFSLPARYAHKTVTDRLKAEHDDSVPTRASDDVKVAKVDDAP